MFLAGMQCSEIFDAQVQVKNQNIIIIFTYTFTIYYV